MLSRIDLTSRQPNFQYTQETQEDEDDVRSDLEDSYISEQDMDISMDTAEDSSVAETPVVNNSLPLWRRLGMDNPPDRQHEVIQHASPIPSTIAAADTPAPVLTSVDTMSPVKGSVDEIQDKSSEAPARSEVNSSTGLATPIEPGSPSTNDFAPMQIDAPPITVPTSGNSSEKSNAPPFSKLEGLSGNQSTTCPPSLSDHPLARSQFGFLPQTTPHIKRSIFMKSPLTPLGMLLVEEREAWTEVLNNKPSASEATGTTIRTDSRRDSTGLPTPVITPGTFSFQDDAPTLVTSTSEMSSNSSPDQVASGERKMNENVKPFSNITLVAKVCTRDDDAVTARTTSTLSDVPTSTFQDRSMLQQFPGMNAAATLSFSKEKTSSVLGDNSDKIVYSMAAHESTGKLNINESVAPPNASSTTSTRLLSASPDDMDEDTLHYPVICEQEATLDDHVFTKLEPVMASTSIQSDTVSDVNERTISRDNSTFTSTVKMKGDSVEDTPFPMRSTCFCGKSPAPPEAEPHPPKPYSSMRVPHPLPPRPMGPQTLDGNGTNVDATALEKRKESLSESEDSALQQSKRRKKNAKGAKATGSPLNIKTDLDIVPGAQLDANIKDVKIKIERQSPQLTAPTSDGVGLGLNVGVKRSLSHSIKEDEENNLKSEPSGEQIRPFKRTREEDIDRYNVTNTGSSSATSASATRNSNVAIHQETKRRTNADRKSSKDDIMMKLIGGKVEAFVNSIRDFNREPQEDTRMRVPASAHPLTVAQHPTEMKHPAIPTLTQDDVLIQPDVAVKLVTMSEAAPPRIGADARSISSSQSSRQSSIIRGGSSQSKQPNELQRVGIERRPNMQRADDYDSTRRSPSGRGKSSWQADCYRPPAPGVRFSAHARSRSPDSRPASPIHRPRSPRRRHRPQSPTRHREQSPLDTHDSWRDCSPPRGRSPIGGRSPSSDSCHHRDFVAYPNTRGDYSRDDDRDYYGQRHPTSGWQPNSPSHSAPDYRGRQHEDPTNSTSTYKGQGSREQGSPEDRKFYPRKDFVEPFVSDGRPEQNETSRDGLRGERVKYYRDVFHAHEERPPRVDLPASNLQSHQSGISTSQPSDIREHESVRERVPSIHQPTAVDYNQRYALTSVSDLGNQRLAISAQATTSETQRRQSPPTIEEPPPRKSEPPIARQLSTPSTLISSQEIKADYTTNLKSADTADFKQGSSGLKDRMSSKSAAPRDTSAMASSSMAALGLAKPTVPMLPTPSSAPSSSDLASRIGAKPNTQERCAPSPDSAIRAVKGVQKALRDRFDEAPPLIRADKNTAEQFDSDGWTESTVNRNTTRRQRVNPDLNEIPSPSSSRKPRNAEGNLSNTLGGRIGDRVDEIRAEVVPPPAKERIENRLSDPDRWPNPIHSQQGVSRSPPAPRHTPASRPRSSQYQQNISRRQPYDERHRSPPLASRFKKDLLARLNMVGNVFCFYLININMGKIKGEQGQP